MDNKTILLVFLIVLIVFVTLLTTLGIIFIIALRKRAPVVKIVMAPNTDSEPLREEESTQTANAAQPENGDKTAAPLPEPPKTAAVQPDMDDMDDDIDEESSAIVVEGQESVRYDRSLIAKIAQLKKESKEWYGELKNELLSYEKVKLRMSWRRETFRVGRMPVARFMVRGKTLCLLLAVEPSGYSGTKYSVEDMSNTVSLADTPTLYRIKSARRLKYAKEMIGGIMKELKIRKAAHYEPKDFYIPYEGDMSFMQRGLVKRVVSTSVRTFRVEETENSEIVEIEEVESPDKFAAEERKDGAEKAAVVKEAKDVEKAAVAEETKNAEKAAAEKEAENVEKAVAATVSDAPDGDNSGN